MRKIRVAGLVGLFVLALLLVACEGYTETGARTRSQQTMSGGLVESSINKANGSIERDIEVEGLSGTILEADVTLSVEKGSYKIELLGEGDQVTLALEASDGEAVSGHGQMVTDSFGEASYRITATEAENVEYTIEYAFR